MGVATYVITVPYVPAGVVFETVAAYSTVVTTPAETLLRLAMEIGVATVGHSIFPEPPALQADVVHTPLAGTNAAAASVPQA